MFGLFKKRQSDPKEELRAVLGDFELPTFPAIVTSALERVRDEDADTQEISELLSSDPGLSVRLLGTVNSASFALRHRVRNMHHAISLLGRNQLESMLISIAVTDALPAHSARGYEAKRFWTTAARRATAARALADLIEPSTRSESFTAALLQDLAIPILSRHKGDAYGEILERWHAGDGELTALEREVFEWDHAEVAWWVSREWGFPDQLADAIGGHHAADDSVPLPAVRLVSLLPEVDEQHGVDGLVAAAHDRYGIAEDQTVELIGSSFEAAGEIAHLFA